LELSFIIVMNNKLFNCHWEEWEF